MPFVGSYYGPNLSKLRAAWRAHYMRKGCSPRKADCLAMKKRHTWPVSP
jgi:hypothetical protein